MNAPAIAVITAPPWYRQHWPWLLLSGPAIVVVAALFTAWLALRSDDGVVAEDYYKRGLLINRDLEKTSRAAHIGIVGTVTRGGMLRVRVLGASGAPAELRLKLAHPTRAGLDHVVVLVRDGSGEYRGVLPELLPGRWLTSVETDGWRTTAAEVVAPFTRVALGARSGEQ